MINFSLLRLGKILGDLMNVMGSFDDWLECWKSLVRLQDFVKGFLLIVFYGATLERNSDDWWMSKNCFKIRTASGKIYSTVY